MSPQVQQIRDQVTPVLRDSGVEFAGVFGSYARGEETGSSDIDFLIRFSGKKSLFDLARLQQILSETLNQPVDVVTEKSLSPYIRDNVLKDLRVIYGRR